MNTDAFALAERRFLVGTVAHNAHVQNMAGAFQEVGALHAYVTGGVDSFRGRSTRLARQAIASWSPGVSRALARRTVMAGLPPDKVQARWGWELLRLVASRFRRDRLEDWFWERGELALDAHCARLLRDPRVGGFLGVEHGALDSLRAAKSAGKTGVVAFLSPHHRTYRTWVGAEFEKTPTLRTAGRSAVEALTTARDARRDEEAHTADWIVTGSSFTTRSLVDAGFAAQKILTVPLAGPDPVDAARLPSSAPRTLRCIYVGNLSVHKGAHYLLRAWRRVARPGLELHFYGKSLFPEKVLRDAQAAPGGGSIVFHGPVPAASLAEVYLGSSVLILPTLCDGFGLVISEAMAHGLPVVVTRNAGAADSVDEGRSGFVIAAADEDAIVRSLEWCADHPRELFDMRRAVLAAAGRRTWTHFRLTFRDALDGALTHTARATDVCVQS